MKNYFLLFSCMLIFVCTAFATQPRKVLVIGIDGTRADALQTAKTPNIDALLNNAFYTFDSWHLDITVSGPSWSSIMTGVYHQKHGVTNNSYSGSNYNNYPYFPTRAKEYKPNLYCVQIAEWAPMSDDVYNDGWNLKLKVPDGQGTPTENAAVTQLANPNLDVLFVYFDAVDLAGHSSGFNPANPSYIAAIENVDGHIGGILNALYARPNYANEDWLILITTDHGGIGTGHGGNTNQERHIWWIASGNNVSPRQLTNRPDPGSYQISGVNQSVRRQSPVQADVAVTALHHLLYDLNFKPDTVSKWNLDGISWLDSIYATSGTRNLKYNIAVEFFPNPSASSVQFTFPKALDQSTRFELLDMSGMVCRQEDLMPGAERFALSVAGLAKGAYLARFSSAEASATLKLMVE
ncbi:MAG: alkaline phosphatase family protein [Bacteroidetes bacterium]|nr:alkaline phosphatase family protein [Bacteroidota bacterium]